MPIRRTLKAWRALRSKPARALVMDVVMLVAVLMLVHAWQTRDLPRDEPAPASLLVMLNGGESRPAIERGEVGVVYFFAPWCNVCHASIGNLDELVEGGSLAWASAVALDFSDRAAVEAFVEDTGISLPVLLGGQQAALEWNIRAFPTYFVIDSEGRIASRSVGYSTKLGLAARTWLAD